MLIAMSDILLFAAKLYDINAELVEERGFLDTLRDLISDPNPVVVANAVAALTEISETSGKDVFKMSHGPLLKLLAALNECTEWGQVFILDCLAKYKVNCMLLELLLCNVCVYVYVCVVCVCVCVCVCVYVYVCVCEITWSE